MNSLMTGTPARQCSSLTYDGSRFRRQSGRVVSAIRGYRPVADLLQRCEDYVPNANDPDRRHGRERWPALIITKGLK